MSVEICCRDQRKMGRVIDQIEILANNVEELRAEINALRSNYLENREDHSRGNDFEREKNNKTDILRKMKKYAKRVTSMYSLRRGLKSGGNQEPYYRFTNLEPPLSSLLNYVFRTGKKESVWHIPTRVKHLRDQGNQTNETPESQEFTVKSPTTSLNMESIHSDVPLHTKNGNEQHSKIIFPRIHATLPPNFSELSCELDLEVESPMIRSSGYEVNIFSDSYTVNNYPQSMQVSLSTSNKQSSVKSTQTKVTKLGQKYKNTQFHSKYPNDCFSKIKNAVIMKKFIRNLNESTYTICEEVDDTKGYPNLDKERCKRCSCWKKRNKFELNKQNNNEENFSLIKTVPMLKTNLTMNKDDLFEDLSEGEEDLSSSSVSVDLEVNISNSSNKIEEFPDRRRPRTYVIHKLTQERNQENWLNHFERNVIYVEQTSDLNLPSYNFV